MKRSELLTMVVSELKALAKKMKIVVPVKAKKADIVDAILSTAKIKKTAVAKAAEQKKAASKTGVKAEKAGATNKQAAFKRAPERKPQRRPTAPAHDWKMPPGAEEPLLAQERVSESKYYTGPANQTAVPEHGELPQTYGEDKIVLMTRDPFTVYAYWETTPARIEREKAWFGWNSKLCVRIYDVTGVQFDGRNAVGYFDQEVFERAGNWYFNLGRPSRSFCADLGLLSPEGRFLTLARSNFVTTPRDGVSDVIDEEWMLVDEEFWKLYGYPEGLRSGSSPGMQEKEMMRRRRLRMQAITSPGLFSPGRVKTKRK